MGDWEDGAGLRGISIVISVLGLGILLAMLREVEATRATTLIAAFTYATLPYQIHYGAELRPYPLLAVLTMAAFSGVRLLTAVRRYCASSVLRPVSFSG